MKRCYVSIQYGTKSLPDGQLFDFEKFYFDLIKPTVEAAKMTCARADELRDSGVIQKAALSATMNSDVFIADVSSHNANVLYELGVRHAANSEPAIVLFNSRTHLPFDISGNYAFPYSSVGPELASDEAKTFRESLKRILDEARKLLDASGVPFMISFPNYT